MLISSVGVSVDGGAYNLAVGTANWYFDLNTSSITNGNHLLTSQASDIDGDVVDSSITITVNNTPSLASVTFDYPKNGMTVSGPLTLSLSATSYYPIQSVTVSVDGGTPQAAQ